MKTTGQVEEEINARIKAAFNNKIVKKIIKLLETLHKKSYAAATFVVDSKPRTSHTCDGFCLSFLSAKTKIFVTYDRRCSLCRPMKIKFSFNGIEVFGAVSLTRETDEIRVECYKPSDDWEKLLCADAMIEFIEENQKALKKAQEEAQQLERQRAEEQRLASRPSAQLLEQAARFDIDVN